MPLHADMPLMPPDAAAFADAALLSPCRRCRRYFAAAAADYCRLPSLFFFAACRRRAFVTLFSRCYAAAAPRHMLMLSSFHTMPRHTSRHAAAAMMSYT